MMISHGRQDQAKLATVVVLDMAAVVQIVRPTSANTFSEHGAILGGSVNANG